MRQNVMFVSRVCLLALLVLLAVASVRVANFGVARADDPVPTYYFSATSGAQTFLSTHWAVDTKLTQGSYRIFKIISVQGTPLHSEQQVNGTGPDGSGNYKLFICPIQPGGEDDLPLAYFYVSGL